ncbi:hypothetical protein [Reichenbachiella sp. MALMAid0571]|uniref:hypothetical protein n=1 Tax=Reichenbachiella sp. MALMAid0571 TaxID=3143939 RepID=UPI0032DF4F7A
MKTRLTYIALVLLVSTSLCQAQETLNANDPNTFIFGGDQKSTSLSVDILPVAIVDVEPDPGSFGSGGGAAADMEAGLPVTGGTAGSLDNLWLNFTHRALNYQPARIYVSTNQPVPAGMTIKVQIISVGAGGDYPKNPNYNQITLSQADQVIVYDFANGYTGDGLNNGYQLSYTIDNPGGASLPAGFEVLYRIQ